jgi:hypothetical protein
VESFRCNRWLPGPNKAARSGWSIFTIEIPTGYKIEERFLKDLVGFGIVRNLRDAENYPNFLNFLFEYVRSFVRPSDPLIELISHCSRLIPPRFAGNSN